MRGMRYPKILVVDDDAEMRALLVRILDLTAGRAGEVGEAADALAALEAIESGDFDLVISDCGLPGASGLDLLAMAQQSQWDVAFILMTGKPDWDMVVAALRWNVADVLCKPFRNHELIQSVERAYRRLCTERAAREYRDSLEAGIQRRTRSLEQALRSMEATYQATLEALVAAIDARERATYAHSFRVRAYTLHLARLVGYPPLLLPHLEWGALLHDIGKIAISDSILLKPAKLTKAEWEEMRKHPTAGEEILRRIPFLRPSTPIVRHHHERFDGQGYPDGLSGDAIPLGARLFAFADTLDAMTSDRCYRKTPGFAAVREEVRRCSGTQFDPRIAQVFCRVPQESWLELRKQAESGCGRLHTVPPAMPEESSRNRSREPSPDPEESVAPSDPTAGGHRIQ